MQKCKKDSALDFASPPFNKSGKPACERTPSTPDRANTYVGQNFPQHLHCKIQRKTVLTQFFRE